LHLFSSGLPLGRFEQEFFLGRFLGALPGGFKSKRFLVSGLLLGRSEAGLLAGLASWLSLFRFEPGLLLWLCSEPWLLWESSV